MTNPNLLASFYINHQKYVGGIILSNYTHAWHGMPLSLHTLFPLSAFYYFKLSHFLLSLHHTITTYTTRFAEAAHLLRSLAESSPSANLASITGVAPIASSPSVGALTLEQRVDCLARAVNAMNSAHEVDQDFARELHDVMDVAMVQLKVR